MSDTKGDLLEATGQLLIQEGYADLTTKKVASKAGVSHPTVHYHFDTKEQLLVAFVEDYTDQWLETLQSIEGENAGEHLAALVALFTTSSDTSNGLHLSRALLELHTRAPHVDPLQEALQRLDEKTIEYIEFLIETGIEEGVFYDVNSTITAKLLLCTFDGAILREYTLDSDISGILTDGITDHILTDLYIDDVPNVGDMS